MTTEYTETLGIELGKKYWQKKINKLIEITGYGKETSKYEVKTDYKYQGKKVILKMPIHYIRKKLCTQYKKKERPLRQVSKPDNDNTDNKKDKEEVQDDAVTNARLAPVDDAVTNVRLTPVSDTKGSCRLDVNQSSLVKL